MAKNYRLLTYMNAFGYTTNKRLSSKKHLRDKYLKMKSATYNSLGILTQFKGITLGKIIDKSE